MQPSHASTRDRLSVLFHQALTGMSIVFLASTLALHSQAPPSQEAAGLAASTATGSAPIPDVPSIREEELKQQLAGKTFYLRGGYLDNDLHFDEHGALSGNSPAGSYTLSMIEISKIQLSKHKLELQGIRYGLHFLGAGPTEDPLQASDKVRITPKKKSVKITLDRAQVVIPKKKKSKEKHTASDPAAPGVAPAPLPQPVSKPEQAFAVASSTQIAASGNETLLTQARANRLLKEALDHIFSPGLDDHMIASLPDFWKLYYQSAASKSDYRPGDPAILRQNTVDQKASLLSSFEPPSNDFAQNAGVAGLALYHVIVGSDGKPGEIAVSRPIGFGLDENAVASIRKASFQPALKDGKPVPVLLDLLVQFRIYSKRTAVSGAEVAGATQARAGATLLPGPYTANQLVAQPPQ